VPDTTPALPGPAAPTLSPTPEQLAAWGLDPTWSRRVSVEGSDGQPVDWHVLDSGPGPAGTVVCVHGNPSWGYVWRDLLTTLPPEWRVIAVDQTGMGWSERGRPRRLADRVTELIAFCRQEVDGPLVLAAHDWGGPVAVGASGSLDVEALILANTAVGKPDDVAVPPLIAAARSLVDLVCRRTPTFVEGTARMTGHEHRDALRAPYRTADRREAVRDFVADIPVGPGDPSFAPLQACAAVLEERPVPTLLLWGGRDPVFHDRFLADLRARAPQADVERFAHAAHLVTLDAPVGPVVARWLTEGRHRAAAAADASATADADPAGMPARPFTSVLASLGTRSRDTSAAYDGPDGTLSWADLDARSSVGACALQDAGLRPGDRVSLLVPPSCELLVAAGAVWKAGGVPVVADASAGIRQLRRLVRAAAPRFVVGTRATVGLATATRFAPGATRVVVGPVPGTRAPGTLALEPEGSDSSGLRHVHLGPEDVAAIVHTSGATGPAKAVRYTHGALAAQRDVVGPLFDMQPGDAFTTSFGPFMLLAPSLQMTCVRPDFPVDRPSALGFDELLAATDRATVTVAWLSPASARRIVSTAHGRSAPIGLVMLAGAPIPPDLVAGIRAVTGGDVRTPWGMTECLPVTDGTEPEATGPLGGNSTGRPVPGCSVLVTPLDRPSDSVPDGTWGELLVHAPWMFDGYDAAWSADADTWAVRDGCRYHRTGDVGYVHGGLVFHLGRRRHVLDTPSGPLASVAVEEPVRAAVGRPVAAVGVGPTGAQVICLVVDGPGHLAVADASLRSAVRAAVDVPVAAVLVGRLPVDRRHESKIDRTTVAADAERFLAGR
jgi:acyl-CoA synthetase (AMP-forming)/AMP-acid ligase II/pimeloyl-ACP methyl ester carboxylesterase